MGEQLDPRIKIRAPLRCDGIGRLDCAEDAESGMRLAVRWLPLEANGDAAVRACARLPVHPTLPRIRQTGHVGASAFVAMDFPEGQVLSAVVEDRLDIDLVVRIAAQLSDALATVHGQHVVHGEMCMESVLLVPPDKAYLWDMPLVIANRLTDRRGENRLMQNLVKTAPYLSPERARGGGATPEGDVYSLGTLLCIAAGAPRPPAEATLSVVHAVASGTWAPRVPLTIPEPWHGMLERMVSPTPTMRPSAREVAFLFGRQLMPAALPTVPELPMVRLPPELLATANALMNKRSDEMLEIRRTVEIPAVQAAQLVARTAPEMPKVELPAPAPRPSAGGPKPVVAAPPPESASAAAVAVSGPWGLGATLAELGATPRVSDSGPRGLAELTKLSDSGPRTFGATLAELRGPAKAGDSGPRDVTAVAAAVAQADPAPAVSVPAFQPVPDSIQAAFTAAEASSTAPLPPVAGLVLVAPRASQPGVPLTDNITVAADLVRAGASTYPAEPRPEMNSRAPTILVAVMAAAILALGLVAVRLALKGPDATPTPIVKPVHSSAPQVLPAPTAVTAKPTTEEELAPLPRVLPARPSSASVNRLQRAVSPPPAPVKAEPAKSGGPPEAKSAPAPDGRSDTKGTDFGFLEDHADPSAGEAKSPSL